MISICNKKLVIIHTIIPLYKMWLYSLAAFNIIILSLIFSSLIMKLLVVFFVLSYLPKNNV